MLEKYANQGARVLRAAGLKHGDHIAILTENRREMLEVCFAADRAGVTITTISTHLGTEEISYILGDGDAQLLITSDRFAGLLPTLTESLAVTCEIMMVGEERGGFTSWSEAMAKQPSTPIADEAQGLDMLYSSGTTGRPKGIKWPLEPAPIGTRTMLVDLLSGLFGWGKCISAGGRGHAAEPSGGA